MENLHALVEERAVLAAICQFGGAAYIETKDLLSAESFSHPNTVIFSALETAFSRDINRKVDIPTVYSCADEIGLKESLEGKGSYVQALFNYSVELSNVRGFARKISKLEKVRGLIGEFDRTVGDLNKVSGEESLTEIAAVAEKPIFDFLNTLIANNQQTEQIGHGIDEYFEYIRENRDKLGGIGIGFPRYEKGVGGITVGVHIIGARTKTGKSFLALNSALHASIKEKVPVLFLDTELRREQGQWNRFIARLADGVTIDEIKYGTFFDDEIKLKKVVRAKEILKRLPLQYRNITGCTIDEIMSIMRRWLVQTVGYDKKGKLNKCLVVYDYLKPPNDVKSLQNMKEHQEIGIRMENFHNFTSLQNIPILTYVQLNRDHDIAIADRIGWYCTSYSSYRKKTPDEIAEDGPQNGNRMLTLEYLRFGSDMESGDYINYGFNGSIAKIVELKTRNEIMNDKKQQDSSSAN